MNTFTAFLASILVVWALLLVLSYVWDVSTYNKD